jgi:hypothetical protein
MQTASLGTPQLSLVRLSCPARPGAPANDSPYADTSIGGIQKNDVDKTICGWEGAPSGAPREDATGPVNHRSAPVSAGTDRESLGSLVPKEQLAL